MTRIGLLSDTHAFWDDKYLKYFENCDEIWHAGDIGSVEVARKLSAFRPFRAVYGNIDGQDIRRLYPQTNRFTVDGAEVLIKHIGGYPGNYDPSIRGSLLVKPPQLFISGHSHILKVKYDKTLDMLHINPGAAGISGFHKVRTLVRFCIDNGEFKDLEIFPNFARTNIKNNMKTYLVTGAAGFIGANYLKYILAKHDDIRVVVLDALTYAGNLGTIASDIDNERCFFVKGDICDRDLADQLFAEYKFDYVVNFAAN